MTTRILHQAVASLAALAIAGSAQVIDINGHVTDQTGAPVAGATVALLGKALWVTSGSDGAFHIDWSSPVRLDRRLPGGARPALRAGMLEFSVNGAPEQARVDVLDLRGRVLATPVSGRLESGSYRVDIARLVTAAGMCLVRLQVGESVSAFRTVPSWRGSGSSPAVERAAGGCALGKQAGLSVDTLAVTKPGYGPVSLGIGSYVGTYDVQLTRAVRIMYSINRGASTVTTRQCSLVVVDSAMSIASLRFTQDTSGGAPSFTAPDADNPVRDVTWGSSPEVVHPWVLLAGGGDKTVYAQIVWRDTAHDTSVVHTTVQIAPWDIGVTIRGPIAEFHWAPSSDNEYYTGPEDATVIYTHTEGSQGLSAIDEYIFGRPWVDFSVDIGGDTSMSDAFEYWVVFAGRSNQFMRADFPTDTGLHCWYECVRRAGLLTGLGPAHDTTHSYRFSMDTGTVEGKENLTSLRVYRKTTKYPFEVASDTLDGVTDNFARLIALNSVNRISAGMKVLALIVRFQGRYFGEDRYYLSMDPVYEPSPYPGMALTRTVQRQMYFDCVPPVAILVSPNDGNYINNGDTLGVSFTFALDAASVIDRAKAPVTAVELVIARKPESLTWPYWNWNSETALPLTYEQYMALPHEIYPCPSPLGRRVVTNVSWDNISALGWPSGQYLIAVVTADRYGNRGFAPVMYEASAYQTNPFVVTVLSGS